MRRFCETFVGGVNSVCSIAVFVHSVAAIF